MGLGASVRGGFGFLLDRHQHVGVAATTTNINNVTPANAFNSLFHRHRDHPLPITPVSIFRSMLQFDDLQALLWAWTLVGILLLFAFWTNPNEASFRPFLTDLVFRERLRLLNQDQDAAESQLTSTNGADSAPTEPSPARKSDPNAFSSLLSTAPYSSGPFALTFGSKVALSLRTPPFHRKDLGLLSIVTIAQSTPVRTAHDQQGPTSHHPSRLSDRTSAKTGSTTDCTSIFIGAFGKWWILGYAIPDLPPTPASSQSHQNKKSRPELEENLPDVPDWGIIEMRSVDPAPESRRSSILASHSGTQDKDSVLQPASGAPFAAEPAARIASPSQAPSIATNKEHTSEAESQDCLSITALVSRSQTDIVELQEQLLQIKSASARACEALEVDLEEIRAKKKEEERLRSDIKTRTKALDDSKRQVESTRREAERRLKTANAARALKQASIQQRKDQVEMLNKRRAALATKKGAHADKRLQRSEELSSLITETKDKVEKLRIEVDALRHEVQAAQDQLQVEKVMARNAQEGDFREQGRIDTSPYMWNPSMEFSHIGGQDAMYAHLASTPDPLVDSLAHMEERALAANRFTPSPFDADSNSLPINQMPNAHSDGYDDLGTSVLRNAFRRANAASVADGREMLPNASQGIGNPSLQNASNFEAIKQAFQPTIATDEDGRRSWSAFDVWQSDLRGGGLNRTQWPTGGANASADSLPQFSSSSGFLPLDRSTSAEQSGLHNAHGQVDAEQSRNASKVKRAFRWPFRPSQVQNDLV
ncbi:hypothetical protein EX895_006412 [Sporisorium graminicola]|uniref:Uncharacterized protein n=1 Tax=Sporisorium graminicola TaxID=280036 RepID=A0A4U7KKC9_9BASI|nr:hypothetical protein EX895_006412 [Sporisorium graminicola]TKY84511.1 hypothetical protein EX895_006412 [Sporisorium graminicola]